MGWVVWSEEHGAWWAPGRAGYVTSLARAGRYPKKEARQIEREANRYLREGIYEVAMLDPWPSARPSASKTFANRCKW